jgi:coenzyme F420-0:L-glutamate ligase/coenzyme F420-1:gamma-L-glutamate ligase
MNDPTPVIAQLNAQATHALLRSRRSIRQYRAEMPAQDKLDRIFASAAMAPSAHNRQPWRYFVICDAGPKAALARAMGERLAIDRRRDGDADASIKVDVERSFTRISGAPVVVLVALTLAEMDHYPNKERRRAEYLMAVQSTAMATQNLLLAAHAEGLGACWMCAPLFCPDVAQRVLALPPDWEPQGLLTLGYPAAPGRLKPRKPQSAFVTFAGPMRETETKR